MVMRPVVALSPKGEAALKMKAQPFLIIQSNRKIALRRDCSLYTPSFDPGPLSSTGAGKFRTVA